jgi:hypothetical protein
VIFLFHFINIDFKYPSPVLLTRTYALWLVMSLICASRKRIACVGLA